MEFLKHDCNIQSTTKTESIYYQLYEFKTSLVKLKLKNNHLLPFLTKIGLNFGPNFL